MCFWHQGGVPVDLSDSDTEGAAQASAVEGNEKPAIDNEHVVLSEQYIFGLHQRLHEKKLESRGVGPETDIPRQLAFVNLGEGDSSLIETGGP